MKINLKIMSLKINHKLLAKIREAKNRDVERIGYSINYEHLGKVLEAKEKELQCKTILK